MATPAEIEQRIAAARAALGPLEAANGAARREVAVLEAEKDQLIAAARKQAQGGDQAGAALLRQQAAQIDARIDAAGDPAAQALEAEQAKIRTLENDLYAAQQKADFDAKQTAPTATAEVKNSAAATQNPAPPPASANERLTTTQAATLAANTDTGTNAPVKTLAQTQSVPPANTGSTEGRPAGPAGAGAGEDGQTASNTQQILNTFNKTRFAPKNNILDQYASYTYNIAWYLMDEASVVALNKTKKPNLASYSLLMQSGGASTSPNAAIARNKFFELDYNIDNLEIKSVITGKGSGRAHNAAEISFTVTETTGITLLDNLYNAVKSAYPNPNMAYVSAIYCLVIRFYGYDETGKIVQASNGDNNNAVVEKILPFKLADITFSVGNKLVEYAVKAIPLGQDVAFGSNLGVIKAPIEITGATVKDLLMNGIPNAEVLADDGRVSSPRPAVPSGTNNRASSAVVTDVDTLEYFTGDSVSPFQVGA